MNARATAAVAFAQRWAHTVGDTEALMALREPTSAGLAAAAAEVADRVLRVGWELERLRANEPWVVEPAAASVAARLADLTALAVALRAFAEALAADAAGPQPPRPPAPTYHTTPSGYRRRFDGRRTIYEHREVMAAAIGRPLLRGESVHHRNGQRDDNRPENLELWNHAQPAGQRLTDKLAWAAAFLTQHGRAA